MPREEALIRASQSNPLILVQHRDSRNHETIPYKTYDYLNIGLPIIALVDNPELSELITKCGGIASDVHSPEVIASDLIRLLEGGGDGGVLFQDIVPTCLNTWFPVFAWFWLPGRGFVSLVISGHLSQEMGDA